MATYKIVNVDQLDADLTSIAEAIKNKLGWSNTKKLTFPQDFIQAINKIGDFIYLAVEYEQESGVSESRVIATYVALRDMSWSEYLSSAYKDDHFGTDSGVVLYFANEYDYYVLLNEDDSEVSINDTISDSVTYRAY